MVSRRNNCRSVTIFSLDLIHSFPATGILAKMKEGAETVQTKLQAKAEQLKNHLDNKGKRIKWNTSFRMCQELFGPGIGGINLRFLGIFLVSTILSMLMIVASLNVFLLDGLVDSLFPAACVRRGLRRRVW